jgi:proline iminopeptidase
MTIWYEVIGAGEGAPLVLVNGGPGFDHGYLHGGAWERLAERRRLVFYDQRGNGRSGPLEPGIDFGLAEQIADLEALRACLGAEKMNLLGHSWGGLLAMAYAALHQERIEHLVLVDSSAPDWGRNPGTDLFDAVFPETGVRRKGLAFASELGDPDAIAQDIDEYISMIFFDKGNLEKFRERVRAGETHYTYTHAVNQAVWNDLPRFDLTPELAKFRFPTLVITGRYDFNVPASTAWSIHRAIPDSEFAVFESSGHMPFFEEQDAFVARLETFLSRSAPTTGR